MFYTYEGGKFYQYQNGSKLLTTDRDYKSLLMMLSNNNKIVVKDSYFILNPKPISKNEIYNRTIVKNEICIN